jgi:hypothetical protein
MVKSFYIQTADLARLYGYKKKISNNMQFTLESFLNNKRFFFF